MRAALPEMTKPAPGASRAADARDAARERATGYGNAADNSAALRTREERRYHVARRRTGSARMVDVAAKRIPRAGGERLDSDGE